MDFIGIFMFLLPGCCVMDSKSSTASINISLNSGSERKLTQLIVSPFGQPKTGLKNYLKINSSTY